MATMDRSIPMNTEKRTELLVISWWSW